MEDMMRNELMEESKDVTPVETNYVPTESNSDSSMVTKAVIVGVVGALAGVTAFGMKKHKQYKTKKIIERLKKEGYIIVEPIDIEDEDVENEFLPEEDFDQEENK